MLIKQILRTASSLVSKQHAVI